VNADHIIGGQTFLAPFVLLAGGENRARYANAALASRQKRAWWTAQKSGHGAAVAHIYAATHDPCG